MSDDWRTNLPKSEPRTADPAEIKKFLAVWREEPYKFTYLSLWLRMRSWTAEESLLLIVGADPDHSDREDRFIMLGRSYRLRILVVCHCYRESEEVIRIISARKATVKEKRAYTLGVK